MWLFKPANLLDLVHQVPTIHIFHHKIQAILKEGSKQLAAELLEQGICRGQNYRLRQLAAPVCTFPGNLIITISLPGDAGGARAHTEPLRQLYRSLCNTLGSSSAPLLISLMEKTSGGIPKPEVFHFLLIHLLSFFPEAVLQGV